MPRNLARKPLDAAKAKLERKKWNVPDWTKPEEYDYVKPLTGDQLRWEFLRRDEKYRERSEENPKPRTHFLLGKYIAPNIKGDKLPDDFMFVDSIRRGTGLALAPPPIRAMLFRKGDPDPQRPRGSVDAYLGAELNALLEQEYVVVAFDPFRPMDPQIKAAKKRVAEAQSKIKERSPNTSDPRGSKRTITLKEAPKLLRAIDAYWERATLKDIGTAIFGSRDYNDAAATAHQRLEKAFQYWRIL